MTRPLNCPNCAAPITGDRCEYCGTLFLDFSCIPIDEPFYLRIRESRLTSSKLITSRVVCTYLALDDVSIDTVPLIRMEFMPLSIDQILTVVEE